MIPFLNCCINSHGAATARAIEGIANNKKNKGNKSSHNDGNSNNNDSNNNNDNSRNDQVSIASANFNSSLLPTLTHPVSLPLPLPLPHSLPIHISANITDLRKSKSYKNDKNKLNLFRNINNNKIKLRSILIKNKNNIGILEESQHFEKENNTKILSDLSSVMTRPLSSSLPLSLPSLNYEGRDRNVYEKLDYNNPMQKIEKATSIKELNSSKETVSLADKSDLHPSLPFSAFHISEGIVV